MKRIPFFSILFIFFTMHLFSEEIVTLANGKQAVLYDDHTWSLLDTQEIENTDDLLLKYKSLLRKGINATDEEILIACEMISQGWTYTMPSPKSAKAGWGISDGRTTWYNGWWYNEKTKLFSDSTPTKSDSGLYLGDNQNSSHTWRNGGSPSRPDVFMFLLSTSGGPRY